MKISPQNAEKPVKKVDGPVNCRQQLTKAIDLQSRFSVLLKRGYLEVKATLHVHFSKGDKSART